MRERELEAYFKQRVEETGGVVRKSQWIARRGCPDRWCGWKETKRTAWVELKGDGGLLSPHQKREILRLRACGERVEVIKTKEDVDNFVQMMSRPMVLA